MNARQKKKLKKRDGHFHYHKYKFYKRVWELAVIKYGKDYVDMWKRESTLMTGYKRNMMIIIRTTRKPLDVELLRGVYPSAISTKASSACEAMGMEVD